MIQANASPSKSPFAGITPLEIWHMKRIAEYRAAHERLELVSFIVIMAIVCLGVVAAAGRILHWLSPPCVIPPADEPPHVLDRT
jgi:hypothetical protein